MSKLKKPKIIFIDLDGTAIDLKIKGHKRISLENIKYIEKAREQGIEVVVSTGRPPIKATNVFLDPLRCTDNFIGWNGTTIYQNGVKIFEKSFEKDVIDKIFQEIEKYKISVIFNSDTKNYSFTSSWLLSIGLKWTRGQAKRYKDFKNNFTVNKMVLWHPLKERLNQFANVLKEKYRNICEIAYTGKFDSVLEITPKGCSKGESEIRYAKAKGIDPADCVHIGDTLNDATCSGHIGTLIAMNNSCKTLKMIADCISPFKNKNAGLGKTIEYYFLDNNTDL
ncbi:HAD family hydrolase [Mycoplasmopsis felifaucium]|uniref:HAD family hydrolase n=1 Tax=Mycoplasmopsis felifaucium TaxID=35768 RepID=A0ABZ2RPV8_9BACT